MKLNCTLLLLLIYNIHVAQVQLDSSFAENGVFSYSNTISEPSDYIITDFEQLNDGSIIIVGSVSRGLLDRDDLILGKIDADGQLDLTFASNGFFIFDSGSIDRANAVAVLPDQKILVAGLSTESNSNVGVLMMFNTDGTLDNSFQSNGIGRYSLSGGNNSIEDIILTEDHIYLALLKGSQIFSARGFATIMRVDLDGELDLSFGDNGVVEFPNPNGDEGTSHTSYNIEIQNDGKILAAYIDNDFSNGFILQFWRLNADGSADTSFGIDGLFSQNIFSGNIDNAFIRALSGEYYIVSNSFEGFELFNIHSNGTLDTAFASIGVYTEMVSSSNAHSIIEAPDGSVLLGGNRMIREFRGVSQAGLYNMTSTGVPNSSFGEGGFRAFEPFLNFSNNITVLKRGSSDGKLYGATYGLISTPPDLPEFSSLIRFDDNFTISSTSNSVERSADLIKITPNPVDKQFSIIHNDVIPTEVTSIKIYNSSGHLVRTLARLENRIDAKGLSAGIYFVKIIFESNKICTTTFLKT